MLYNDTVFKGYWLRLYAARYVKLLPKTCNTIITTGSSGAILGAAITIRRPHLQHIHIKAHRAHKNADARCIDPATDATFVDDFVYSGKTVRKVLAWCIRNSITLSYVLVVGTPDAVYWDKRVPANLCMIFVPPIEESEDIF